MIVEHLLEIVEVMILGPIGMVIFVAMLAVAFALFFVAVFLVGYPLQKLDDFLHRRTPNNGRRLVAFLAGHGLELLPADPDWRRTQFVAYRAADNSKWTIHLKSDGLWLNVGYLGWHPPLYIAVPDGDNWLIYPHDEAYRRFDVQFRGLIQAGEVQSAITSTHREVLSDFIWRPAETLKESAELVD